ncbi:MAG: FMN-binding protein [Acetatifactor sp.]|nr:FMN-binding protein [Acetatifactor sp.]
MLKEAGILFCITLIAGLLLGFVYELTKEPRRIQQEKAIQEACIAVFPDAKEQGIELQFEDTGYVPDETLTAELAENKVRIGTVFAAYNNDTLYGYVVESVSAKGYGGNIVLYVGVGTDGTVNGVSITEISETAGLGMEAPKVLTPQFAGKKVESFVYTKNGAAAENEVDVISSATITTRAVTNAVNGGLKVALELLKGGAVNE